MPNWSDIPQGWEALRYAEAGMGQLRSLGLPPPNIKVLPNREDPYQKESDIGIPEYLLPLLNTPYIPRSNAKGGPSVNDLPNPWHSIMPKDVMSRWGTGILPHELTHYLNQSLFGGTPIQPPIPSPTLPVDEFLRQINEVDKSQENWLKHQQQTKQFAANRVQELGPYKPMYATPAMNQHDNPFEQLAERVAQPYTDAQEVGRRYKMFVDQGKQIPFSTKRMSETFNRTS